MPVITPSGLLYSVRQQINNTSSFYTDEFLYQAMSLAQNIIYNKLGINELTSTSNSIANTREYLKPSGCVSLERVTWDSYPLKRINLNNLDSVEGKMYGSNVNIGQPAYYYEYGTKIGLSLIPDSAKEIKYYYRGNPQNIHSTSTANVLLEKTADLTGEVYNSTYYYSLNSVKVDGVAGLPVLPDCTLSLLADAELIINGVIYKINSYIDNVGSTVYVNNNLDGFSLNFFSDPNYVALRWNYDTVNGGFDLTATDSIYLKYYNLESTEVASEFSLPEEYLYPIEFFLLYKMFQKDDMYQESQQYYRMWQQGLQELMDLRFSRNENLVDNCIGETEFYDWDIAEDD